MADVYRGSLLACRAHAIHACLRRAGVRGEAVGVTDALPSHLGQCAFPAFRSRKRFAGFAGQDGRAATTLLSLRMRTPSAKSAIAIATPTLFSEFRHRTCEQCCLRALQSLVQTSYFAEAGHSFTSQVAGAVTGCRTHLTRTRVRADAIGKPAGKRWLLLLPFSHHCTQGPPQLTWH